MTKIDFEQPPLVVFDLDGTLIDTAPDLLASLNHVIIGDGMEPVDEQKLRKFVGFGGRVMIQNAYEDAERHLEDQKLDHLLEDFVSHYASNMPGSSQPYPGLMQALENLKEGGCKFAICTNKTEALSHQLIDSLGLSYWFEANCGQDTFPVRKPHPDHLLRTIEMAGSNRADAIMIGDTPTDFATAKAAGIPLIAVDFGYCDEPVSKYEPNKVISHYDELTIPLISELLKT